MKKNIGVVVLVAVVLIVASGFVGYSVGTKAGRQKADADVMAKLESAKSFFQPLGVIYSVGGPIKEVSERSITITATSPVSPLEDLPMTRKITIGGNTEIVVRDTKDSKQYEAEMKEYQKKVSLLNPNQNIADIGAAPTPFKDDKISLGELKVGWIITASAENDIKMASEFEATKVIVLMRPLEEIKGAPNSSATSSPAQPTSSPASVPAPVPPPTPVR